MAKRLKHAGLNWKPNINDFFAIPDRGMDKRIFVISDMMTNLTKIHGEEAISFQGSPEWALDYLITTDVVWLPRESQVREALAALLEINDSMESPDRSPAPRAALQITPGNAVCSVEIFGQSEVFEAQSGADAYGQAYLFIKRAIANRERSAPR